MIIISFSCALTSRLLSGLEDVKVYVCPVGVLGSTSIKTSDKGMLSMPGC